MSRNRLGVLVGVIVAAILIAAYFAVKGRLLNGDQLQGWWLGSAFGVNTAVRLGRSAEPTSGRPFLMQILTAAWLGLAWAGILFALALGLSLAFDNERTISIAQAVVGAVSIVLFVCWWIFLKRFGLASRTRAEVVSEAHLEEVRRKAREDIAKFVEDLENTTNHDN